MFNSESDKTPSRSSSKMRPSFDRYIAVADQTTLPVRHHSTDEEEHHTRLGEHSAVLWKFNKFTDVTVKLNDEKYPAHKTVLSCYSRYLKNKLLESDGKQDVITLKLKHVSNEAFSILLRYMYTSELELTCQNIGAVYTAARKLGMDGAVDICSKILQGEERRDVHSVYVFVTAWKMGLDRDTGRALGSMCRRFEQIVGTREFLDLDYEQVVEYLKADELATRSEVIVYLAALKWLSVRYLEREEHAVAVVSCVRFPKMTLGEVLACHSPPLLPGLVEMPEIKEMLLKATCFVAAKTTNEEKRFLRYDCPERTYLLEREAIILWDPSIFDPARYSVYEEEVAASTIQAGFRNYQTKKAHSEKEEAAETIQAGFRSYQTKKEKEQEQAAETIQNAFRRHHSQQRREDQEYQKYQEYQEDQEEYSADEDYEWEHETDEDEASGGGIVPFAKRIRNSIVSLFRGSSEEMDERDSSGIEYNYTEPIYKRRDRQDVKQGSKDKEEDTYAESTNKQRSKQYGKQDSRDEEYTYTESKNKQKSKQDASQDSRQKEYNYSVSKNKRDSKKHVNQDSNDEAYARTESKHKQKAKQDANQDSRGKEKASAGTTNEWRSNQDVKQVEKSVAKLAKTVDDTEEDTYGAIVISGGYNGDDSDHPDSGKLLLIYEPAVGEWSTLGEMHKPRHHHRIVYLNGFIYCIGGCNPVRTKQKEKMVPVKSCFAFDMTSRTWKKIAKMRHCRVYHATAVLNGKIYVAGGKDERDCMLDSVEVYDPDLNSWEQLYDPLETPTIGAGMCSKDERLWIVGGMSQDSNGKIAVSKKVSCYDPKTEQWTTDLPSLPYPRAFASAVVCGSRVFVIGGSSHAGPSFPTQEMSSFDGVYFYDDAEKEWKSGPRLPTPRHFVGAVAVYKSLFVLGGLTSFKKQALDDILLLNEEKGTWVLSARIPGPLCGIGAASVPKLMLNKDQ